MINVIKQKLKKSSIFFMQCVRKSKMQKGSSKSSRNAEMTRKRLLMKDDTAEKILNSHSTSLKSHVKVNFRKKNLTIDLASEIDSFSMLCYKHSVKSCEWLKTIIYDYDEVHHLLYKYKDLSTIHNSSQKIPEI